MSRKKKEKPNFVAEWEAFKARIAGEIAPEIRALRMQGALAQRYETEPRERRDVSTKAEKPPLDEPPAPE